VRIVVHDYAGHPFQTDLSRELAGRGHTVRHMFFAGDQGPKGAMRRKADDPPGFSVEPIAIGRDYLKRDFVGRWRNDRAYGVAAASRIGAWAPDLVISGNTPLDAQGTIQAGARRAGAVFVNWIQDFYGLAIERLIAGRWLGAGRLAADHYRRMERRQLERSDAIVLISDDFRRWLPAGAARRPCAVIANWGPIGDLAERPKVNPWSLAHGLDRTFNFVYSGTLGLKHDPAVLVALADSLCGHPDVRVVVAATGMGREALDRMLSARPRRNLVTLPLQPVEAFADVLGGADVLVALLEADAGAFSAPSKVLSYLCAGRADPVLRAAGQRRHARPGGDRRGRSHAAGPDGRLPRGRPRPLRRLRPAHAPRRGRTGLRRARLQCRPCHGRLRKRVPGRGGQDALWSASQASARGIS
jgi:colanic acid biosynthesis glycosyl transferase WcaI